MSIFKYLDYREALRILFEEHKKVDSKYTFSWLADRIGVQKTYVSRVMKQEAHFSTDQLFAACEALELNSESCQYLFLLLEYNRTGLARRKKQLKAEIQSIQQEHRSSRRQMTAEFVEGTAQNELTEYYTNPFLQIVHMFLTIPRYQQQPQAIKSAIHLSSEELERIFGTLERLRIIERVGGRLHILRDFLQLPRESVLCQPNQAMLRLKSIDQITRLPDSDKFSFSFTISLDEEIKAQIKDEFLVFLKKMESLVRDAPAEEVMQLNFDFFPWSLVDRKATK